MPSVLFSVTIFLVDNLESWIAKLDHSLHKVTTSMSFQNWLFQVQREPLIQIPKVGWRWPFPKSSDDCAFGSCLFRTFWPCWLGDFYLSTQSHCHHPLDSFWPSWRAVTLFGMAEPGWRCWAVRTVLLGDLKVDALWPLQQKEPWIRSQKTWVLTWLFLVDSPGSRL